MPEEEDATTVTMKAGSVLVFAGNLYHRAVRTGQKACASRPQYNTALHNTACRGCARSKTWFWPVPPDIARNYSSRIQSLLGYDNVPPGFMGYVDDVHPKRLLDESYVDRFSPAR